MPSNIRTHGHSDRRTLLFRLLCSSRFRISTLPRSELPPKARYKLLIKVNIPSARVLHTKCQIKNQKHSNLINDSLSISSAHVEGISIRIQSAFPFQFPFHFITFQSQLKLKPNQVKWTHTHTHTTLFCLQLCSRRCQRR